MSFLSSIFNPASGTPGNGAAPLPNPALGATPAPQPTPNPAPAPAPVVPPSPTSELDKFTAMWQNATTSDGKPLPPVVDPLTQPIFNFDPAKIQESASKMDFTTGIDPAVAQKALSGDVTALSDVINSAVRAAVVGMTLSNGRLINDAVVSNNQRVANSLPTHIRQTQLLDSTLDNPVFNHPAVQPLVTAMKQTEFQKNPNKPVAEIEAQVANYFKGLAIALQATDPANVSAAAKVKSGETDWLSYTGQTS